MALHWLILSIYLMSSGWAAAVIRQAVKVYGRR